MIEFSVKGAGLDKTTVFLGWILFCELFHPEGMSAGFIFRNKNRNSSINVVVKMIPTGSKIIFAQNINTITGRCVFGIVSVVECIGTVK